MKGRLKANESIQNDYNFNKGCYRVFYIFFSFQASSSQLYNLFPPAPNYQSATDSYMVLSLLHYTPSSGFCQHSHYFSSFYRKMVFYFMLGFRTYSLTQHSLKRYFLSSLHRHRKNQRGFLCSSFCLHYVHSNLYCYFPSR